MLNDVPECLTLFNIHEYQINHFSLLVLLHGLVITVSGSSESHSKTNCVEFFRELLSFQRQSPPVISLVIVTARCKQHVIRFITPSHSYSTRRRSFLSQTWRLIERASVIAPNKEEGITQTHKSCFQL